MRTMCGSICPSKGVFAVKPVKGIPIFADMVYSTSSQSVHKGYVRH